MEKVLQEFHFPFDENNPNWCNNHVQNLLFLRGIQSYMNQLLLRKGFVFLNDVLAELRIDQIREGQTLGWSRESSAHIELGIIGDPVWSVRFFTDGNVSELLPLYKEPVKAGHATTGSSSTSSSS